MAFLVPSAYVLEPDPGPTDTDTDSPIAASGPLCMNPCLTPCVPVRGAERDGHQTGTPPIGQGDTECCVLSWREVLPLLRAGARTQSWIIRVGDHVDDGNDRVDR